MFYNLVSLPNATEFLASTTDWASPIFSDLLPFVYVVGGLSIGVAIILFLIKAIKGAFHHD